MTIPPEIADRRKRWGSSYPLVENRAEFSEALKQIIGTLRARVYALGFLIMGAVRAGAQARHGVRSFRKHPAHVRACLGLPIMRAIAGAHGCVLGFDAATIARTYDGVR